MNTSSNPYAGHRYFAKIIYNSTVPVIFFLLVFGVWQSDTHADEVMLGAKDLVGVAADELVRPSALEETTWTSGPNTRMNIPETTNFSSTSKCQPVHGSDYDAGYFKIMVIADTHIDGDAGGGDNWDGLEHIAINLQNPDGENEYTNIERVVVVGDVVSAGFDKTHTFNRIEKAKEIMDRLWYTYKGAIPYVFVMGNHDYKLDNNDNSDRVFLPEEIFAAETKRWRTEMQRFPAQPWKPYWQQIHNGWKFIYLNSFRGNTVSGLPNNKLRHFDDEQIEWLRCELSSGHRALVFMHHPVMTDNVGDYLRTTAGDIIDETSDPKFMELIDSYRDRIEAMFVGHVHQFIYYKLYDKIKVRVVGSIAEPTAHCDHPKFIVEGRAIGHDGSQAPFVEIERGCQ